MTEYDRIVDSEEETPNFQRTIKGMRDLPLVYQYRNFNSFWQILKSDSFWATNARFCNDIAEQQFGMEVIASLCNDANMVNRADLGLDENYIVCFCLEDDKLSQWRGYASEGGVSMGFDFGMPRAFSVLSSTQDIYDDKNSVLKYVALDAVRYIVPKRDSQSEEDYREYCNNELALKGEIPSESDTSLYRAEIQKKAPYIKHSGFQEEQECRLVFRNHKGDLDKCVRYREVTDIELRYPYIVVKAALPGEDVKPCVVRVCIQGDQEGVLVDNLEKKLKETWPALVQGCHVFSDKDLDADEPFCTGCVLRRWEDVHDYQRCRYKHSSTDIKYEYFLHEKANCVVISQGRDQKEIFEAVHSYIQEFNQKNNIKIPVWCEGHLPLRKITVGPCGNQGTVIEAIKHYCKHTYWLRDVEIVASSIPFRRTL